MVEICAAWMELVAVCVCSWETLDSFMQHDVQELCRVVSSLWSADLFCCIFQGSYRSGNMGKSQGIWVVREMSGENFFFSEKLGKMKNWCHHMSDFQV